MAARVFPYQTPSPQNDTQEHNLEMKWKVSRFFMIGIIGGIMVHSVESIHNVLVNAVQIQMTLLDMKRKHFEVYLVCQISCVLTWLFYVMILLYIVFSIFLQIRLNENEQTSRQTLFVNTFDTQSTGLYRIQHGIEMFLPYLAVACLCMITLLVIVSVKHKNVVSESLQTNIKPNFLFCLLILFMFNMKWASHVFAHEEL